MATFELVLKWSVRKPKPTMKSWAQWLPCDRLLTALSGAISPLPAFSQVTAFHSGWTSVLPLRGRSGVRQVWRSSELSDQAARDGVAANAGMPLAAETHITAFETGRRQAWVGNCVGIGEAAVVFDPIDSVSLQGILLGMSHLTSLLPLDRDMAPERKEYNHNIASAFDRIRDYQICHYKLNQRRDDPFWDQCRDMALPDSLAYKLRLFEARGHLVEYDDETFAEHDWHAMLIGHGLIPRSWDPLVDETPDTEVIQHIQNLLSFIRRRVASMRPMEAYFHS